MSKNSKLLIQKLVIAFVVGFGGMLVTSLTGLANQPNFTFDKAAVISLIVGALSAGLRAVLALGPINLVPSDTQHSIIGGKFTRK